MMARTKLVYRCDKYEDFDYAESRYYMRYDRSYDMYVTADTKEECEAIMESFEDAICAEDIQNSFDSNLDAELDEKTNKWVGAVEIYISNDDVAYEKEQVKEVYNEWKRLLKATPVVVEAPKAEATPEVEEEKEIEKAVIECEAVGGKSCEECCFDGCNKESFELVLNKSKKKAYVPQKERVQQKMSKLEVGKKYCAKDDTGLNIIIFKDASNMIWFGTKELMNSFYSLVEDYQEYLLDIMQEIE